MADSSDEGDSQNTDTTESLSTLVEEQSTADEVGSAMMTLAGYVNTDPRQLIVAPNPPDYVDPEEGIQERIQEVEDFVRDLASDEAHPIKNLEGENRTKFMAWCYLEGNLELIKAFGFEGPSFVKFLEVSLEVAFSSEEEEEEEAIRPYLLVDKSRITAYGWGLLMKYNFNMRITHTEGKKGHIPLGRATRDEDIDDINGAFAILDEFIKRVERITPENKDGEDFLDGIAAGNGSLRRTGIRNYVGRVPSELEKANQKIGTSIHAILARRFYNVVGLPKKKLGETSLTNYAYHEDPKSLCHALLLVDEWIFPIVDHIVDMFKEKAKAFLSFYRPYANTEVIISRCVLATYRIQIKNKRTGKVESTQEKTIPVTPKKPYAIDQRTWQESDPTLHLSLIDLTTRFRDEKTRLKNMDRQTFLTDIVSSLETLKEIYATFISSRRNLINLCKAQQEEGEENY